MIPKIVHYIWLGDRSRKPVDRINKWHTILPGWEFREWTENSLDLNRYSYVRTAYDMKRYGICIDPFRPYILYTYGGIWLDTDVNVYKNLSDLLDCSLLVGCHFKIGVSLGVLGTQPQHPVMKKSIEWYDEHFTKNTVRKGEIDSYSFANAHGTMFAPEPLFLTFLKQLYNISCPGKTIDISTFDGIIRFEGPNVLATRPKSNPKDNYAEHLYEGSWCKDVRHI
jgi:hypothetical protein